MAKSTDKQIRYAATLARQLEIGDEWDLIAAAMGYSRSKAQKKGADMSVVSEAIDWANAQLETLARREGMPEGSIDENEVLLGGEWLTVTDESMTLYRQHAARLDLPRLVARLGELIALDGPSPLAVAIREQIEGPTPSAKNEAIAQIRALMAQHGISVAELGG